MSDLQYPDPRPVVAPVPATPVMPAFPQAGPGLAPRTVVSLHRGAPSRVVGKTRNPWGVWLLSLITIGIYPLIWYFKINKELRDFDPSIDVQPGARRRGRHLWSDPDRDTADRVLLSHDQPHPKGSEALGQSSSMLGPACPPVRHPVLRVCVRAIATEQGVGPVREPGTADANRCIAPGLPVSERRYHRRHGGPSGARSAERGRCHCLVHGTAPPVRSGWRRDGQGRWYAVDAYAAHASQIMERPRPTRS